MTSTVGNRRPGNIQEGTIQQEGGIQGDTVPLLVHALHASRATGVLTIHDGTITKTLHFGDGCLLFASSDQRDDRLSHFLLRADVVPLKGLMKALEVMVVTKDRLGDVLVRFNLISRDDLERWVRVQVREIAWSVFQLTRGDYLFEPKPRSEETITTTDTGDQIVLDGIKRISSWARVVEQIGGLHTEYRTTRDAPAVIRGLTLSADETRVLEICDQTASLEEICDASGLKDYDLCKIVWAFLVTGALMRA